MLNSKLLFEAKKLKKYSFDPTSEEMYIVLPEGNGNQIYS